MLEPASSFERPILSLVSVKAGRMAWVYNASCEVRLVMQTGPLLCCTLDNIPLISLNILTQFLSGIPVIRDSWPSVVCPVDLRFLCSGMECKHVGLSFKPVTGPAVVVPSGLLQVALHEDDGAINPCGVKCGALPPESCWFSLLCSTGSFLVMLIGLLRYAQVIHRQENSLLNMLGLCSGWLCAAGLTVVGNFQCSTISRRLHHAGPHAHRPLPRLSLTPRHRHQRLQWCRTRLSWSDSEWQRVIFSDESRFSLGGDAQRIRVWRHRGPHQDERFTVTCPEDLVSLHLHPYRTICRNCVRMFKLHGMDYHRTPSGTSTAPYRDVRRVGLVNTAVRRHTERQTSVDFAKVLHYVGAGLSFPNSLLFACVQTVLTYRLAKTQRDFCTVHLRVALSLLALVTLVLSGVFFVQESFALQHAAAVCEWLFVIVILLFYGSFVYEFRFISTDTLVVLIQKGAAPHPSQNNCKIESA
ncbi:hypothetical protein NFI96_034163 [Prochilodus magdalenae]|nr:hypothetical protein NFI96_034163 [Prochilodus magdalenae]